VPIPSNRRNNRAVARLDRLIYGFIEQNKREGGGDDLLTMLMDVRDEDGSRMSTKQIRDEAVTIFLAGHETTAITLSWTFYLLSQNPDAEEKAAREVATVIGDRKPEAADVARLPYLSNAISESMQLASRSYRR